MWTRERLQRPQIGRPLARGMTVIEALASLAAAAALAVGVAQLVAVSARTKAANERRSDALLAAGNALEVLRAAEPRLLEEAAAKLRDDVAGLPGTRLEVQISEATVGDLPVHQFVVSVAGASGAEPLTLVGWQLAESATTPDTDDTPDAEVAPDSNDAPETEASDGT
ncbi:hypothetical protein [Candidatus Laterigemmans baculatus]|uniref:hypothetical protein n=1 Tax=Candidatus Laterigemmans baculatus TaxID=2770505 RepID=UPI0013DB58B0|nr:hypothetical protein [Candidatus Laterigemmans baculatus]